MINFLLYLVAIFVGIPVLLSVAYLLFGFCKILIEAIIDALVPPLESTDQEGRKS